jgi:hypothetical protein
MNARTEFNAQGQVLPAESDQIAPQISDDPDLQQRFEEFIERTSTNNEGLTLRVYRVPTDPQGAPMMANSMEWLFACPIDRYSIDEVLEKVRNEYIYPSENGITIRMMVTQKGVRGTMFNRLAVVRKGRPNPDAPSSPESPQHLLTVVGKMMLDQQTRTEALFREAFQRQPPSNNDFVTQLAALVTAGAPIIQALMNRTGPSGGVKEAMETIALAKTLIPGGEGSSDSVMPAVVAGIQSLPQLLDALNKARAMQPPTPVQVRPVQPAAIAAPIPPPEPALRPPQSPTVPPPESAGAPVEMGATPPGGTVFAEISKQLNDLATMFDIQGTSGLDPEMAAKAYSMRLPETLPPELEMILFEATGRAQLDALAPKIKNHKVWFDQFYAALQKIYSNDGPAPGT